MGYVISCGTLVKNNIAAWVVVHGIHINIFIKWHKSDNIKHGMVHISAQHYLSSLHFKCITNYLYRRIFDLWNLKIGLHFMITICLIQNLHEPQISRTLFNKKNVPYNQWVYWNLYVLCQQALIYNHGHNILRLSVWPKFPFTKTETKHDY